MRESRDVLTVVDRLKKNIGQELLLKLDIYRQFCPRKHWYETFRVLHTAKMNSNDKILKCNAEILFRIGEEGTFKGTQIDKTPCHKWPTVNSYGTTVKRPQRLTSASRGQLAYDKNNNFA